MLGGDHHVYVSAYRTQRNGGGSYKDKKNGFSSGDVG